MAKQYKQDPMWSMVSNLINIGGALTGGVDILSGNTILEAIDLVGPVFGVQIEDSVKRSKIKNKNITLGQIISSGANYLSLMKGMPNASIMEFELQLQGRVYNRSKMTAINNITFYTPGSYLSNLSNKSWSRYPMYNEAMGVFALLEKPSVSYDVSYTTESFQEPYYNGNNNTNKLNNFFIKFDKPIEYTLNPAAEINLSKSEIKALLEFHGSLIFKSNAKASPYPNDPYYACDNDKIYMKSIIDKLRDSFSDEFLFLDYYTSNNDDTILFKIVSKGIPIDNVDKVYIEKRINTIVGHSTLSSFNTGGGENNICKIEFNFPTESFLKFDCSFTHLKNEYGIENKSKYIYTYSFNSNKIDAYNYSTIQQTEGDYNSVIYTKKYPTGLKNTLISNKSNLSVDDMKISGNFVYTSNQVIVCDNLDIINSMLSTNLNVNVTFIVYGSANVLNSIISPNITIIPMKSFYNDDLLEPVSNTKVKEFCNGAKYKAKEPLKSVRNYESVKDFNSSSSISLHPNPTSSKTTLTLSGYENTSVSVMIFDLVGREVYTQLEKDITAREHQAVLNTESLQAGTYIVKVFNGTEEKIAKLVILKN
jgi:hypothetical protein